MARVALVKATEITGNSVKADSSLPKTHLQQTESYRTLSLCVICHDATPHASTFFSIFSTSLMSSWTPNGRRPQ